MPLPINLLQAQSIQSLTHSKATTSKVDQSFSNFLGDALEKVNQSENNAEHKINLLTEGKAQNLHDVMIAVEKSEITLKLAVEVRNRAVSAYQEIMRMQV